VLHPFLCVKNPIITRVWGEEEKKKMEQRDKRAMIAFVDSSRINMSIYEYGTTG